jgi:hypothetical protein
MVFNASDFTKLENKEQPASKNDEATVKPAEIEVSVPERDQDTGELVCEPASKKDVEANLHSSGVTWQAVTQQGTEVAEAEINQVETTFEALPAYRMAKKDEATVTPAEIEVSVPERDQDTEELVPQPASKKDAGVHELLQVRRPPAVDLPVLGLQLASGEAERAGVLAARPPAGGSGMQ